MTIDIDTAATVIAYTIDHGWKIVVGLIGVAAVLYERYVK